MNAVTPTIADPGPRLCDVHRSAVDRANAWRGRCIDTLAQGEAAVTDCLLRMVNDADRGAKVKAERLLGQRLQSLANAIDPNGPFAADGKGAVSKLKDFREHEALRTMLCHGKGKVLVDCSGRWSLFLVNVEITNRKPTRHERIIHEVDADTLAGALKRISQQLCSVLGAIPKS